MKKNITVAWQRVKNVVQQNKSLGSVVFTLFCILIGGILTTIGTAIFEPTYVYPSIKIFIVSYLAGGILFIIGLAAIAIILLAITIIMKKPEILLSGKCIVPFILLLIIIFLL